MKMKGGLMAKEDNQSSHFLLGVGIGAILGLLFAPAPGRETRKKLKDQATYLYDKGSDVWEEAALTYEVTKDRVEPVVKEFIDEVSPYFEELGERAEPYKRELAVKVKEFVRKDLGKELEKLRKTV